MRPRISSPIAFGSRPGAIDAHEAQDHPHVLHVGADRVGDARVLHLDGDVATVVEPGAVDLADRRRGDRVLVELVEDVVELVVVLLLEDLAHVLERDLRRGVAQLGELGLELLAVLLGHEADVQEREDLAELHGRALHRAQRGDDLLGRLVLAARERLSPRVLASERVGRTRPGLSRGLPGGQPPDT